MKLVWHLVILVCLIFVCASASLAQEPGGRRGGAVLSLSANVTPASIIEVSSKSNCIEEVETTSPAVRTIGLSPQNLKTAEFKKETPAGTLIIARVEFLVRFSGYKEETATILVRGGSNSESLKEGDGENTLNAIAPGQLIRIEGVRSGSRIIRYIGFLLNKADLVTEHLDLTAHLTYELTH